MSNIEPSRPTSHQSSTRSGIIAIAAIMLLLFAVMAAFLLWTFGVQRPAQSAQATQRAEQARATVLSASDLGEIELVLDDQFDDNSAGWPEDSQAGNPGWNVTVEDGAYVWELSSTTNFVLRQSPESAERLTDFILSVDVDQVEGVPASYGLIFRSNNQRYYQFEISEAGSYVVFVAFGETQRSPMITRESSRAIDRNGPNRLMVIANGDSFAFYVNDVLIGQDRHGTFRDGRVGLSASISGTTEPIRVTFDNFQLYVPEGQQ